MATTSRCSNAPATSSKPATPSPAPETAAATKNRVYTSSFATRAGRSIRPGGSSSRVAKNMGNKVKSFSLVGLGVVAGITVSLQFSAIAQKVTGGPAPLPLQELRELTDVFGLIKTDYVEPVDDKKLLTDAISGMVASLDPHSVYLDAKAFREMRETVSGKFVGIGIEVGNEDGYIKVISPIEDSPAFKAGIKAGDLITRINGAPIKGEPLDDAVKKMRGEPHSKVELTITRKDQAQPLVFTCRARKSACRA